MHPVLLVLSLVLFAFPAAATISAALGPYAVADSSGKLVGGLLDLPYDGADLNFRIALNTPAGTGTIAVNANTGEFSSNYLFFTTPDCTGQVWGPEPAWYPRIDDGPELVVGPLQTLYAVTGPLASVAVASRLTPDGICQQEIFTSSYSPVTYVGDLAAEFTAPFHIVTVASQTAAVPIEIGWLLGGLLLGLGVKRVVKK